MRSARTSHISPEEEYELMIAAARLVYEKGRPQAEVAKQLEVSQSTVSRLLERARREGVVKFHIEIPPAMRYKELLEVKLRDKGIRRVYVVPSGVRGGSGKNTSNLGAGGAKVLIDTILRIPKKRVSIGMSCGDTLTAIFESFMNELAIKPDLVDALGEENKEIDLYPLALYDKIDLNIKFPHSIITNFAATIAKEYNGDIHITPYTNYLPEGFYGEDLNKKEEKDLALARINKAKDSDIILFGIGIVKDNEILSYVNRHIAHRSEDALAQFVAESNYIPIDKYGNQDEVISSNTVAINIDDLRKLSKDKDRQVIAIAGGPLKKEAIQAALIRPFFNVFVTDSEIARHILYDDTSYPMGL
jgi:DNA-binding transcriptional regulator LsrR (DeoR family)